MSIKNIEINNNYLPYEQINLNFENGNGDVIRDFLVFGRNGSGKSTIAKALSEYRNNQAEELFNESLQIKVDYFENENSEPNFFIYDDGFIENKIKFSENENLEAIVMFGDQEDLTNLLTNNKKSLERVARLKNKYQNFVNEFDRKKEINKVLKILRGGDSWSERANRIESKYKQNKRVDEDILQEILQYENDNSIETLFNELNEHQQIINSFTDADRINEIQKYNKFKAGLRNKIKEVLSDKSAISFSENLDENMKEIFEIFGNKYLEELDEYLQENPKICKTCFRPLDKDYVLVLREKIKQVFENDIIDQKIQNINSVMEKLPKKFQKLEIPNIKTSKINNLLNELENETLKIKSLLTLKTNNLTNEYSFNDNEYNKIIEEINVEIEVVNNEIRNFNKQIEELSEHKTNFNKTNYMIAYLEVKDEYREYLEKVFRNEFDEYMLNKTKKIYKRREEKKNTIETKLNRTEIALNSINKELALIFLDKQRLVLESRTGYYTLLVRGKNVPLSKLSTGEKNVLSLVYFFSIINKDKRVNEFFKEHIFLVLDDPISSFDYENKIGIYNYIRRQFNKIYDGNIKSQILITTHDMEVYFNLEKVFLDIVLRNGKKLASKVNKYILSEKGLDSDKKNKLSNMYKNQLNSIYDFANGNANESETYIGNSMRRVCEAFSTFKYRCGIDELRTERIIIESIKPEKLSLFFENYLFRLILNNESHESDNIKGITDRNIFDYLNLNEKVKTAKLIILFLYKLDEVHILRQLSNKSEEHEAIIGKINEWDNEISELL